MWTQGQNGGGARMENGHGAIPKFDLNAKEEELISTKPCCPKKSKSSPCQNAGVGRPKEETHGQKRGTPGGGGGTNCKMVTQIKRSLQDGGGEAAEQAPYPTACLAH